MLFTKKYVKPDINIIIIIITLAELRNIFSTFGFSYHTK